MRTRPSQAQSATGARLVLPALWITLWFAALLVLVAGAQLYVLTDHTDRFFAWTVEPGLSAAALGAFYWASLVLLVMALRSRAWVHLRASVPGVFAFTSLTLVLTLIHWDRFHIGADDAVTAFVTWAWVVVYATVAPALGVLLILQARVPGTVPPARPDMPGWFRALFAGLGVASIALGVALFVAPERTLGVWPWELTPLTARAIAAWLLGVGIPLALSMREGVWRRAAAPAGSAVALAFLHLVALARYADDVQWERPAAWVYVGVWVALGLAGGVGVGAAARSPIEPAERG